MKTLILGGAKSGKSLFAENLALQSHKKLVYIATALAGDAEMEQRISLHQQRRTEQMTKWLTIEEPIALAKTLLSLVENTNEFRADNKPLVLVDCLTLWLSNLLLNVDQQQRKIEIDDLFEVLQIINIEVIFVSNETGLGIVPMNQLSREFIDLAGGLHQRIATTFERVILIMAGLPLALKGTL